MIFNPLIFGTEEAVKLNPAAVNPAAQSMFADVIKVAIDQSGAEDNKNAALGGNDSSAGGDNGNSVTATDASLVATLLITPQQNTVLHQETTGSNISGAVNASLTDTAAGSEVIGATTVGTFSGSELIVPGEMNLFSELEQTRTETENLLKELKLSSLTDPVIPHSGISLTDEFVFTGKEAGFELPTLGSVYMSPEDEMLLNSKIIQNSSSGNSYDFLDEIIQDIKQAGVPSIAAEATGTGTESKGNLSGILSESTQSTSAEKITDARQNTESISNSKPGAGVPISGEDIKKSVSGETGNKNIPTRDSVTKLIITETELVQSEIRISGERTVAHSADSKTTTEELVHNHQSVIDEIFGVNRKVSTATEVLIENELPNTNEIASTDQVKVLIVEAEGEQAGKQKIGSESTTGVGSDAGKNKQGVVGEKEIKTIADGSETNSEHGSETEFTEGKTGEQYSGSAKQTAKEATGEIHGTESTGGKNETISTETTLKTNTSGFTQELKNEQSSQKVKQFTTSDVIKELGNAAVKKENNSLVLQLTPEELGKVDLKITFSGGLLKAAVQVENEQAKQALEQSLQQMKQTLPEMQQTQLTVHISVAQDFQQKQKPVPQKKRNMKEEHLSTEENKTETARKLGYNTYEFVA